MSIQPEFPRLRRVTETAGGEAGIVYFDTNGDEFFLAVPTDWEAQQTAGTPYVLSIVAGLPAWVATASSVVDGYGSGYGDSYGQS